MSRVLLAFLNQESCSFVPNLTELDSFRRYYLLQGQDIISHFRGGGNEVSGIIEGAAEDGIELVPVLAAYGGCGGPLSDEAYGYLHDRILEGTRQHAGEVDGAVLALHGAMATASLEDPEGDLLSSIRAILGPDKPIVASFDLHAHITDQMIASGTAFVAYHTYPHVDFVDAGRRAVKLLGRILRGEVQPRMAHRKLRMTSPPPSQNTTEGPMLDIMARVVAAEQEPGMLAASIFPVQAWLDVANLGWSIVTVADGDAGLAQRYADEIGSMAWERRHQFVVHNTPIPEALEVARNTPGGPIVLADSSDGISGGAMGDTTWLLQGLLASPVPGPCLMLMTDPEAVAVCVEAGVRSEVTLEVGGKLAPDFSKPVKVTGRVRTISDGKYEMKLFPAPVDRGRTVVLQIGDIYLVLSESPAVTYDEEVYRSVGLFPREAKLVQMKANIAFRPVFDPFARLTINLDAPGPTDSNLLRLPFRKITRPLFPFDDI